MNTNIVIGRSNFSATIFVPYDCENRCAFCTSKASYETIKSNLEKVKKKIRKLNKVVSSFVLTGGEPFANLDTLSEILEEIDPGAEVFVNTTLPTSKYTESELADFINKSRITAINVSRHCSSYEGDQRMFCKNIASDAAFSRINKPMKINCVCNENTDFESVLRRWEPYKNVYVSFRGDYRQVTRESLRDMNDKVMRKLLLLKGAEYVFHGGCDVCFDVTFQRRDQTFSYHRGMESSSIQFGNNLIVNDLVLYQDGVLCYDWDRTKRCSIKKRKIKIKET